MSGIEPALSTLRAGPTGTAAMKKGAMKPITPNAANFRVM
jgi:hypothetical protein